MTQQQAIDHLEAVLGRPLDSYSPHRACTGNVATCPVEECMICGVRDCPDHEPLHYHHDGCPVCWQSEVTR